MTNYILEYYQKITDGSIVVGKWIKAWYSYIIKGLESKSFFYAPKKAEKAIRFIETFARHHEGALAPNLIKLELWQKALISVLFGVVDGNNLRQFREVVIVIARKNGKTLLAAAIAEYALFADGEYGGRCYFVAPKLDQSRICYDAFYQMVKKEPELSAMVKRRRTDIYIEENNSSAQPLAFSAKKSDGLNISLCVADEYAAWQGDAGLKQYEVLKSSMGARTQPILLSISTAGYVQGGIYDELIRRSTAVLNGTSKETRLAPFLYMIDDADKWNDINELQKSNPNLGVSVSADYMLEEIAVAEGSISKKREFLTKYCNLQQNSSLAWLSAQDIKKSFPPNDKTLESFRGCYALAGIDLSQTVDLTAATLLVEKGGVVYYFTHFWLPKNKCEEATARDGLPYAIYAQRGLLSWSGENIIDYEDVYNWFAELVSRYDIYVLKVGYDRYSAQYLVQKLEGFGFHCDSVYQGPNLTGVINDVEGMMKDGRLQCADDNDLMKIHWMDSALKLEEQTNRKQLVKIQAMSHIDGVASLLDAMCMRHVHYDELGEQLKNLG